jgi:cardiolipin synthase
MRGWTTGNELTLLENGEEFFPRLFEAIGAARKEILLETFIWSEDEIGRQLRRALIDAAGRGVRVRATVDGYGCPGFSSEFLSELTAAGVRIDSFDPCSTMFRIRTNPLCRLHRKIAIVDAELAFVGGINFGEEHLRSFGGQSKQDYTVEVKGPVVKKIQAYCDSGVAAPSPLARRSWRYWLRRFPREMLHPSADAQVLFAIRDNNRHPTDIETMYRLGIRNAKRRIILANAYFFPGYRFIRDLGRAASRGVDVRLIMQGNPDRPVTVAAASIVYEDLLAAGVKIFRYTERPLHAKVATIDDHWATVGSSNLDPISLGLNLEANLFILDTEFNGKLTESLERLIETSCRQLTFSAVPKRSAWRRVVLTIAYHVTRRMSSWGRRMPLGEQHLLPMRLDKDVPDEEEVAQPLLDRGSYERIPPANE